MGVSVSGDGRLITIPSLEYVELVIDAGLWRMLHESPHVAGLLSEWSEWDRRRQMRESSWGVAAVARGRWDHVSYAEIARRRATYASPALSAEEVRIRARESWAAVEARIRAEAGAT